MSLKLSQNKGKIVQYGTQNKGKMTQNYFCGGCDKQIPIVIGINQLHICECGTLNNIGDAE